MTRGQFSNSVSRQNRVFSRCENYLVTSHDESTNFKQHSSVISSQTRGDVTYFHRKNCLPIENCLLFCVIFTDYERAVMIISSCRFSLKFKEIFVKARYAIQVISELESNSILLSLGGINKLLDPTGHKVVEKFHHHQRKSESQIFSRVCLTLVFQESLDWSQAIASLSSKSSVGSF